MPNKQSMLHSLLAVLLGGTACFLSILLFRDGELVSRKHPAGIALCVLCFFALFSFFLISRRGAEKTAAPMNFHRYFQAMLALPAGYACISLAGIIQSGQNAMLGAILYVLALLSLPCLIAAALLPQERRELRCLLTGPNCVFLLLNALCRYRMYGTDPQVYDYILPVMACVFLMVFFYQRSYAILYPKIRPAFGFWRMAALFFSAAAIYTGGVPYAAFALWLFFAAAGR